MQFYIYDFSEMEPHGSSDMEFGEQGNYSPLPDLDSYWRVEGFRPLLIRVKERLAGFALINTRSRRRGRVEHNMAEFFVARKHRRRGVATEAVCQVLARYPGHWEIAVAERNVAAKAFWPRAIGAVPNVSQLVQLEGRRAALARTDLELSSGRSQFTIRQQRVDLIGSQSRRAYSQGIEITS